MNQTLPTTTNTRATMLFLSTFVSMFLLAFGLGVMGMMFVPVFAQVLSAPENPPVLLPIAANRDPAAFNFLNEKSAESYPALTAQPTDVEAGNWIRIPSIGVAVPLAQSPTLNDKDVISTLEQGAAMYPNGVGPGHLGNVFIAAHSTGEPWRGKYRFAFLKINEIKNGDTISLDFNKTRYTYKVVSSDLVHPDKDFRVTSDRPVPTVTIMACWPLWTANQRMLVKAELTNVTKLTATPR